MPLPDLIEIVPLTEPVRAEVTVPGSKSITNRALILAALADGQVTLQGALWSEDTQVMADGLQKLGFEVRVEPDPNEACNRTITVQGLGGRIPNAGTVEKPLELFVGNAGTAARFLAAMVCLGAGVYRLHGVPRMHERPQVALFQALRQLGYRVDSPNDKLPAVIVGRAALPVGLDARQRAPTKHCRVSIAESCQFASALLLGAARGGWEVEMVDDDAQDLSYVRMTREMIKVFPHDGGTFQIEPDASSGSYFWAVGWLLSRSEFAAGMTNLIQANDSETQKKVALAFLERRTRLKVPSWPTSGWQMDADFTVFANPHDSALSVEISRARDLADSIMTAIVVAPFAIQAEPVKFTDLGRLRIQECERVMALRTELTRCGAKVVEEGDTLTVHPSKLHGAEIETYNDHRMAMCFAILGLKVPGIKIKNPACVKKTFPNFFQKLAAPPPRGLGTTLLDGHTGRRLEMEELFAD